METNINVEGGLEFIARLLGWERKCMLDVCDLGAYNDATHPDVTTQAFQLAIDLVAL